MAYTLQNLIDQCEIDLADVTNQTFQPEDVELWTRAAIADYTAHFQTLATTTINCSAADHEYDLPADLYSVLSVEYPSGEDPKQYLDRRPYLHPDFWSADGYYDLLMHRNDTDPPEIVISNSPSAGESIIVTYLAYHDHTIAIESNVTVPAEHHHILRAFVTWQAISKLKAAEEASPTSNSSLLMSQLAINVDRARRAYVDTLARAVFADSRSAVVSWDGQTEETTRIY